MSAEKKGRNVRCSLCGEATQKGTSQLYRKILFHFCVECWRRKRAACNALMQEVAD